ncbi:MAG: hypothetical protein HY675_05610 [Chloroflexi bacterium]|nr:hypothetical protein [Chloroflexota bacterium]
MAEAQLLYKLQTLDLEIEDTARSLEETEAQLGETEELTKARARVVQLEGDVRSREKDLRSSEWQVDDLVSKIKPLEIKLYGGTVKNPKELDGLQKEVEHLKRNKDAAEYKAIELMEELDELRHSLQRVRHEKDDVEDSWQQEQRRLQDQKDGLLARLEELNRARQALAAGISGESLHTYDDLRRTKRGRAVAKVEQNTCQGCRVSLPSLEAQRARTSAQLSFCGHCGRILWVAR